MHKIIPSLIEPVLEAIDNDRHDNFRREAISMGKKCCRRVEQTLSFAKVGGGILAPMIHEEVIVLGLQPQKL